MPGIQPVRRKVTPDRWKSKAHLTIDDRGSKPLETVFSIAVCCKSDDLWQSKTLFPSCIDF